MSIVIAKGNDFSGQYTQAVIATATDWTGTVKVYSSYPGTAIFSVDLTMSGDGSKLLFTLPADDILNLNAGVYAIVGNIVSNTLDINTYRVDYITIQNADISGQPTTVITMTILKVDGSPAGSVARTLVNSVDGATAVSSWRGVSVTASHQVADEISGVIIGTETVSTETNAAGYAQLSVIKGQTVIVSCPSFGKNITVDTTGHDTIDLSSYF